jgi:hypothetical protein
MSLCFRYGLIMFMDTTSLFYSTVLETVPRSIFENANYLQKTAKFRGEMTGISSTIWRRFLYREKATKGR